jgi:hypothetical protein
MEIEGILNILYIYFMLTIQIHFIGCRQYIKRFIIFRAPDCQSTEGYLFALVHSFSYVFYIIVENRKTTVYFQDHGINNYLLEHIKLLIVMQCDYTELTLLDLGGFSTDEKPNGRFVYDMDIQYIIGVHLFAIIVNVFFKVNLLSKESFTCMSFEVSDFHLP